MAAQGQAKHPLGTCPGCCHFGCFVKLLIAEVDSCLTRRPQAIAAEINNGKANIGKNTWLPNAFSRTRHKPEHDWLVAFDGHTKGAMQNCPIACDTQSRNASASGQGAAVARDKPGAVPVEGTPARPLNFAVPCCTCRLCPGVQVIENGKDILIRTIFGVGIVKLGSKIVSGYETKAKWHPSAD